MFKTKLVTPEKLMTKELINILKHLHQERKLNRLVVDEVRIWD